MQQGKQPLRARLQLLARLTLNAGKHPANQPARLAHLDHGNDRAILVQGHEGPAQIVRLGHRGTPSIDVSDEIAILAARPIASLPSSGESTNHRFLGGGAALTPRPSSARRSIKPLPTTTSRAADLVLRNVLEGKPCDKTSTLDQVAGFEAQRRDLEAAGCTRIFAEQISSVADRPELAAALDYLRDEDTLVATKIDRLAHSVPDLLDIVARAKAKGAKVEILNLGNLDPGSVNGKLILTVLGAIAAFEREMMLERQREGIARAKAEGKYKGRKPTARNQANQVRALAAEGVSKVEIARRLGMHRASGSYILRMPPGFCANATSAGSAITSHPAAASTKRGRFMSICLPSLVAPSLVRSSARPAVEPCYPRPIC